jgi:hypothetical protein
MNKTKLQLSWSFEVNAAFVLDQCLSVKSCFNIHNEKTTANNAEPIAARSATNDIFFSSLWKLD